MGFSAEVCEGEEDGSVLTRWRNDGTREGENVDEIFE